MRFIYALITVTRYLSDLIVSVGVGEDHTIPTSLLNMCYWLSRVIVRLVR